MRPSGAPPRRVVTSAGRDMGRGSLLSGLPFCCAALVCGCAWDSVSLGDNVDAGQAMPADAGPVRDAVMPSPEQVDATDAALGLCVLNPTFAGVQTAVPGITRGTSPD